MFHLPFPVGHGSSLLVPFCPFFVVHALTPAHAYASQDRDHSETQSASDQTPGIVPRKTGKSPGNLGKELGSRE
jgi:hypothetical protein